MDDVSDDVATATVFERPDARTFVSSTGDADAIGPLVDAIAAELPRAFLHTIVDDTDPDRQAAFEATGFVVELTEDVFTVPFDRAIRAFAKAPTPTGYSIISAADADRDRLVDLDNLVRQDVPGCDGWAGDRAWLDDELDESPPFDPSAYLIGAHDATGEYAGLIRIWRNRGGPRFGLIGVTRPHRHTTLAAALLRRGLTAAAEWGSPTFTTETSLTNAVIHHRMARLGGERTARFHQLVRRGHQLR